MEVQERNGIKSYEISSTGLIPEWLTERQRRNWNKRSTTIRRRIELLQGLDFPIASTKLVSSLDGKYLMGIGTYKPRVKCFDIYEMGMKFERYLDAEGVDVCMLGCYDWGKMGILCNDRSVVFHAPYGHHYKIRLPSFGRSMIYQDWNCHLTVASTSCNEIYRIDLEEGRFVQPLVVFPSGSGGSENNITGVCMDKSPTHKLLGVGCSDGAVRFYDGRNKNSVVKSFVNVNVYGDNDNSSTEVTSMSFSKSGIQLVTGGSNGTVCLYDMRSSKPLHVMQHSHGLPIHTSRFHNSSSNILSSDSKVIKLWNTSTKELLTNIEASSDVSHSLIVGDANDPNGDTSGLILCSGETPKIQAYFCPTLGKAPQWCSYLDSITEELEEGNINTHNTLDTTQSEATNTETIYQDYKFVTNEELDKLGITNLIGTSYLRGYMHGYFMDQLLYNRVRSVAQPFEYEQYRKDLLKEKLKSNVASRILNTGGGTSKKSKVNQLLQEKLVNKSNLKSDKHSEKLLQDSRFQSLFENPDFQIDEDTEDFKLRHPSNNKNDPAAEKNKDREEDYDSDNNNDDMYGFTKIQSQEQEESSDDDEDEDEDGFARAKVRGENYKEVKSLQKSKRTTMYEATDETTQNQALLIGLGTHNKKLAKQQSQKRKKELTVSLNDRLAMEEKEHKDSRVQELKTSGSSGRKEVMYIPKEKKKRVSSSSTGKR